MIIKESKYITSGVKISDFPDDNKPEIAFLGRSNVGKSSLINAITKRKNLARTSSNPGKTQTVNFFLINNDFYLVDFPGYGYAKVGKEKKATFMPMIKEYVTKRMNNRAFFLLVDYKIGPTKDDIAMYNDLVKLGVNIYIILTKADKLKQSELVKNKKLTTSLLGIDDSRLFVTSSESNKGIDNLLNKVEEIIQ